MEGQAAVFDGTWDLAPGNLAPGAHVAVPFPLSVCPGRGKGGVPVGAVEIQAEVRLNDSRLLHDPGSGASLNAEFFQVTGNSRTTPRVCLY